MKTKNLIERLSLFLLALVLTMPTWAQGGSGNESETITIASKEDWKTFCNRVNSGQITLNAKLTKDVDLGEEIVMAGTKDLYSLAIITISITPARSTDRAIRSLSPGMPAPETI